MAMFFKVRCREGLWAPQDGGNHVIRILPQGMIEPAFGSPQAGRCRSLEASAMLMGHVPRRSTAIEHASPARGYQREECVAPHINVSKPMRSFPDALRAR